MGELIWAKSVGVTRILLKKIGFVFGCMYIMYVSNKEKTREISFSKNWQIDGFRERGCFFTNVAVLLGNLNQKIKPLCPTIFKHKNRIKIIFFNPQSDLPSSFLLENVQLSNKKSVSRVGNSHDNF